MTLLRLLLLLFPFIAVAAPEPSIFDRNNLVAWCIVPFDAKKRGPEERAAMLEKLGVKRLAYDYRAEHVPQFDAEMEALKKHGIELTAWWFPTAMNDEARLILDVIKRHGVNPQLWVMGSEDNVEAAVVRLKPICEAAAAQKLKVALYNHGSWFGEPENQLAIIERLRRDGITNCGIVYNLHHGHAHLARFAELLENMKPHLLALNLNGMIRDGEAKGQKIVPLAQGELDVDLLRIIQKSGWRGPVGILNHTDEDAEARLLDNLDGLDWLVKELASPGSAGAKPVPRSWKAPAPARPGANAAGFTGRLIENDTRFRQFPLTVECRARLDGTKGFNILAACDPKSSAAHWELYTYAGAGDFSAYLPGRGGEVRSGVNICDGQWHTVGAVLEENRIRLYVDGREVKSAPLPPQQGEAQGSGFAVGRLVEGTIGCEGDMEAVRIRRGVHDLTKPSPLTQRDDSVLDIWTFQPAAPVKPAPKAASFPMKSAPLVPEQWPNCTEPVNRDRVYDFYLKQAQHFRGGDLRSPNANEQQGPEVPATLLPEFPGLDGGKFGHWGNQNEDTWRDGRLNDMDCGPCVSGVFRSGGLTVPKAFCAVLDENSEWAVCFDSSNCQLRALLRDGFIKFSDVRHGLMDGLQPAGKADGRPWSSEGGLRRFLGYYRHGKRTVFAYKHGDQEVLKSFWRQNRALLSEEGVRHFTKGGPAQWPVVLETTGSIGKPIAGWPYVVDTLTLPFENPWKTLFFIGGHDFFSNGDIALCTMTGDVWRVSGVDAQLSKLRWKRMAAGLHQPLGLVVAEDKVCVLGRDQITRLHDLNDDGEADFYECLTNDFETPTGGHDFMCGLERDAAGNFYTASANDGLLKLTPGRRAEVIATGFRNPDGLGLAPDGTLTVPYSEGEWTPTSAIAQITPGGFYGYRGPQPGKKTLPPLVWLPRGIDNSSGGQTWVPDDRWGPLKGQLIHTSYGAGTHMLILRQRIGDVWQGAAVPLPGDFNAGVHRARFSPHDGQLYLSGMCGWGTYTPHDGCLQRVRYTGGPVQLPVAFEARDNGILLTFSERLDAGAGEAKQHFAQCWNYRYSAAYGSPELSLRYPNTPGHDVLEITSAHILRDGRSLFLEIPQLQPAHTIHLAVQPQNGAWRELFITAHVLGLPFTEYPEYKVIAKTLWTGQNGQADDAPLMANPFTKGQPGRTLRVESAAGLQFATKDLTARAGERVSLTFANPDVLPHNWVLLSPGSFEKVGELANRLISDPRGFSRHYVPDVPEVLAWTDMVNPNGEFTIHFDAPAKAGEYPYICTFPGHWMVMKGVLRIQGE